MCDLICILCLVKCDQPAADDPCAKDVDGQHDWYSWNDSHPGIDALKKRNDPRTLAPRPRQLPICECGSQVVLVSTNSSITVPVKEEQLVTEKTNYQCFTCHAWITFTRMSGDDPQGWIGS